MAPAVGSVSGDRSTIDDIVWSQGNHLEVSFSDGDSMPVFADMVVAKVLASRVNARSRAIAEPPADRQAQSACDAGLTASTSPYG
jgi:hypothetical protein